MIDDATLSLRPSASLTSGFVHDRRCNSIIMSCCFLGFVRDRQCNSIMTPVLLLHQHLRTMVYFTERCLSGVRHLVVLSDRNQPREDGLDCAALKIKIDCVALKMIIVCAALKMMIA
ncbi:hypothetical protein E5676_scaffold128G00250 [Cucumis melo var. makuwa]|uniref:Uncharacterized protein n=1 Tax=Cucumis melo var. makuwa TaxID=1194695 RepID=A0A5D3BRM4_CUCMM|nr:hypothetical protein E5676_scaffold128G00250 [Cucumis melo var. makuwa]